MYRSLMIFTCLVLLSHQSFAFAWCNDDKLETLIKCLVKTFDVEDWTEQLNERLACVKIAYCTPRPWDHLDYKSGLVRNFAECMETIPGTHSVHGTAQLIKMQKIKDYICRKNLADDLPAGMRFYASFILQNTFDE